MAVRNCHRDHSIQEELLLKALSEKVRSSDKEGARISLKSRLSLARERAASAVVECVIIANVERCSRAWIPAEQGLPAEAFVHRIVIETHSREHKSRELIGRSRRDHVSVERADLVVIAHKAALVVADRHSERIGRLVFSIDIRIELKARAGILQAIWFEEEIVVAVANEPNKRSVIESLVNDLVDVGREILLPSSTRWCPKECSKRTCRRSF